MESRGGRSVEKIALEVGCVPSQLYACRRLYGITRAAQAPVESAEAEPKRARLELAKVTRERDFLEKCQPSSPRQQRKNAGDGSEEGRCKRASGVQRTWALARKFSEDKTCQARAKKAAYPRSDSASI